mgnify:CR=1 FL=1
MTINYIKDYWNELEAKYPMPKRVRKIHVEDFEDLKLNIYKPDKTFIKNIMKNIFEGDFYIFKNAFTEEFMIHLKNKTFDYFKSKPSEFFQMLEGTPDFLRYTPEMTASFLMEPRVVQLVNNEHPGKLSTRTSKHMIYSQNMKLAQRSKFTGWEKLEKLPIMQHELFKEFDILKEKYNGVYELGYNDLVDELLKY